MRAEPLEVYLPCDVLTVKVHVAPQEHLSSLEELFLQAVHAGARHFHELVDLFGIGPRPTLDLVFDLWHRGYLVLDLVRGSVDLASQVSRLVADDRLDELGGGEGTDETREVMLDRITGHVLPLAGRRGFPPSRLVAPAEHFDVGIQDITDADLLGALRRVVEAEERAGRAKKVLAAHLSLSQLGNTREQRWLPIYVACTSDDEGDGLGIRLVDGGALPATARTRVVERIAQIVEDLPDSPFAKYLREGAAAGLPPSLDIDDLLDRLGQKSEGLAELDVGLFQQRQEQLDAIADEFDEWLNERRGAEVGARVVVGHAQHADLVAELLRCAKRQALVVCPWLRYDAFQPLVEHIKGALDRGVQVFLLWGIKPDDDLDQRVRNALLQLRQEYPALFFVSQRSSRTHAKLVVQDDRRALATSLNFLAPSSADTLEVGVLMSASDGEAPCPPIERLLDWVRGAYPEFTAAQSLYLTREDFSRTPGVGRPAASSPPRPVCPKAAPEHAGADEDALAAAAARLWQLSWGDYLALARALSTTQATAGRVVIDGQHRDILWRALRTAEKRLLVASDQLGPEVIDGRFLKRLEERLSAGVHVAIIYRRPLRHVGVAGADPVARLAELQAQFPERLHLVGEAPTHAKILVFDDVAVVSSFNFLSFEGYYEERRPSVRRKQRSEVGIMLTSAEAAQAVVDAVRGAFPDALRQWVSGPQEAARSEVTPPPLPPVSPAEEQELLFRLAEAEDDGARAAILKQTMSAVVDPWWLLDRLSAARVPDSVLRTAAAVVLCARWAERRSEPASRWLRWLAGDSWRRKRFVEAAVLCSACPAARSPDLPAEPIVMLAAGRSVGKAGPSLATLSNRTDMTEHERFVIAAVAMAELMVRGEMDAWTALENHGATLPTAWREVAGRADAYWKETYQALPMTSIRAEVGAARHRKAVDNAWENLATALNDGATANFKFESGTKTREYLYHPNGPLGRLRSAAAARNANGVAAWLAAEAIDDLDEFLDDATRAATGRDDQLFDRGGRGGKRRSYLKTLGAIVAAARAVVALARAGVAEEESRRIELARPVAEAVHRRWTVLRAEAETLDPGERVVIEVVLDDLRVIADWGAAR